MIERNLGNTERVLRLILGIILAGWAVSRGQADIPAAIALLAALALVLNFWFSRCYLWSLLGINTCNPEDEECRQRLS
jgi:hypothetical protein